MPIYTLQFTTTYHVEADEWDAAAHQAWLMFQQDLSRGQDTLHHYTLAVPDEHAKLANVALTKETA